MSLASKSTLLRTCVCVCVRVCVCVCVCVCVTTVSQQCYRFQSVHDGFLRVPHPVPDLVKESDGCDIRKRRLWR
jgi:hypothetical protein